MTAAVIESSQAALTASEERFRAVAETATDAIVSADQGGSITYFNAAAERIFGRSASEVLGKPLTVLMPERFHDAHRRGLERFISTGESRVIGRTVELAGLRQDGSEFPVELSLASWRAGGEVLFAGILRDITERKRVEEELRSRTSALAAANRELEAFSYSVSHDLRAPLRSMDGFSQALLEDYSELLDGQARDYLGRIRAASRRMAALIDGLLTLSRVTRTEIHREPVDLSALGRAIAGELQAREPEREVACRIAGGLVVDGDARLLRTALENLLGNAWKFTGKNERAAIELGVAERSGERVYLVSDDGAGFDPAYADKLFAPFQRLHSVGEFEGDGIGLATVHSIVHRHGGRIWAESEVGQGATFFFTVEG